MKLYYKAGACALAPHIVMAELNMAYEIEAVDLKTKMTANNANFLDISIKGQIPALKMDSGEVLTEGAIISQYLCDSTNAPTTLLGQYGTLERLRTLEMMNFIATEVHKNFSPLFSADSVYQNEETKTEVKNYYKNTLTTKFTFINEKLGTNDFLTGTNFTIADAYLFTCVNWAKFVGLDYSNLTNLTNYMNRVSERPSVMRAMREEGMIK